MRLNSAILRQKLWNFHSITSLTIEFCKILEIESNFIRQVEFLNLITQVKLDNVTIEKVKKRAFDFNSPVNLTIQNVREKLILTHEEPFGLNIEILAFKNVNLVQFSSNVFHGMLNASTSVRILDSRIESHFQEDLILHDEVHFNSFEFINVTMEAYKPFLNVGLKSHLTFKSCDLALKTESALRISAEKVIFKESKLKLHSREPLKVTTAHFEMVNCELEEPLQGSLLGITRDEHEVEPVLMLKNLTLKDPAKGTLITRFLNVQVTKIKFCLFDLS